MFKVLIVDDEPFILDGMPHVVKWEEYGLEIAAKAADGIAALDILEKNDIHLLIVDIRMPRMDGLELIRQIKKRGLDIKIIILSGYDDFQYVKEAVKLGIENYLLKPVEEEELSSTLLNTVEKLENELYQKNRIKMDNRILKDNILFRWVTGNIGPEELMNRADLLDINLFTDNYLICIVRALNNRYPSAEIRNICEKVLLPRESTIFSNFITGDTVILFSWKNAAIHIPAPRKLMELCMSELNRHLKENILITIGPAEAGYQNAHKSYSNACKLLDYQFLLPPNTIIDYENVKNNNSNIEASFSLKTDYELLKNFISSGNLPLALEFIDTLYAAISKAEGVTPEYVRSLVLEILFNVFGNLHPFSGHCGADSINRDADLYEMLSTSTLSEVFSWLKSVIENHIHQSDEAHEKINPIVKSVLQFIDKNYDQEMSLKTLSGAYNINAAYLGQLFKNATGEMFTNYLNRVRIEKAKEMLTETNAKSCDIAVRVGYGNINYFSNIFKKLTGLYPIEYRSVNRRD